MRVKYYTHPLFLEHNPGRGHPERKERLKAIDQGIEEKKFLKLEKTIPHPIPLESLSLTHQISYIEEVLSHRGKYFSFDPDTHVSPSTVDAALLGAGAVLDGVDAVLEEGDCTAFCALRPPGHHAESNRAMGFCFFNHVALGAAHAIARRGLKRVLIIDPDVHHGNGTQEIFYHRRDVCYISIHQYPFYPGSGSWQETGEGDGRGFNINFPLPEGQGNGEYFFLSSTILLEIFHHYKPELILFSAGFDAHEKDPLGGMNLTTLGFLQFYSPLVQRAWETKTPFLFVLEGGYSLEVLQEAVPCLLESLQKEEFPSTREMKAPAGFLPLLVEKIRKTIF